MQQYRGELGTGLPPGIRPFLIQLLPQISPELYNAIISVQQNQRPYSTVIPPLQRGTLDGFEFELPGVNASFTVPDLDTEALENAIRPFLGGALGSLPEVTIALPDLGKTYVYDPNDDSGPTFQSILDQAIADSLDAATDTLPAIELTANNITFDLQPSSDTAGLISSEARLRSLQCEASRPVAWQCACPADYVGARCQTPRNFTCSVRMLEPSGYESCESARIAPRLPRSQRASVPQWRQYGERYEGDPPCLVTTRTETIDFRLSVDCAFTDTRPKYCNGTALEVSPVALVALVALSSLHCSAQWCIPWCRGQVWISYWRMPRRREFRLMPTARPITAWFVRNRSSSRCYNHWISRTAPNE